MVARAIFSAVESRSAGVVASTALSTHCVGVCGVIIFAPLRPLVANRRIVVYSGDQPSCVESRSCRRNSYMYELVLLARSSHPPGVSYEVRDSNFGDPVFWVFGLSDTAVCAHLEKHVAKQANQNKSVNNRPPSNYHK